MELEGVVWGLDRAMDLIDMAEEEQGHQAPHPQPSLHWERPATGGNPQKVQNTKEDEKLLIDGGDDMSEGHYGSASPGEEVEDGREEEPLREAPIPEGPQALGKPTPKEL